MPKLDAFEGPHGLETPRTAAAYIATLAEQLALIARRHGLSPLGYILDMARLEASQVAKGSADARRRA